MTNVQLSLPDDLSEFIARQCGEGTAYATVDDYISHVLEETRLRHEARSLSEGIVEGMADVLAGRTVPFRGDLRAAMEEALKLDEVKS